MGHHKYIYLSLFLLITLIACNGFGQILDNPGRSNLLAEDQVTPETQVVIALEPIQRGDRLSENSVGYRDWPSDNIPPDTIFDKTEVVGQVTDVDLVAGQLIVRRMFSDIYVVYFMLFILILLMNVVRSLVREEVIYS